MRHNLKLAVNTLGYGLQLNHLSDRTVFGCHILLEGNMFTAEYFLSSLVKEYGKLSVSTDGVVDGIHHKLVNS
ncbi:MAG TPA: hypothetical protein VHF08_06365 [Nitrososphaeraceae archaeon]|nr:hypothetical protein [Nitrososphaeraceae archaeon]